MFSQGLISFSFFFKCYHFIYLQHFFNLWTKIFQTSSGAIKIQELAYPLSWNQNPWEALVSPLSSIIFGQLKCEILFHGHWEDRTHGGSKWKLVFSTLCLWSRLYLLKKLKNIDHCFTVFNTLLAWKYCNKNLNSTSTISIYSPINQNPDLNKYIKAINIHKLANFGKKQFKGLLLRNRQLKSFNDLRTVSPAQISLHTSKFGVLSALSPGKALWVFFVLNGGSTNNLNHNKRENLWILWYIIHYIIGGCSSFPNLLMIWEKDLDMELNEITWLNICDRIHFPFTSNKIKEANFKFIHKLYLTPI